MSSSAEEVKRDNADADGNMKHSGKMQIKCSQEGKSAVAKKKRTEEKDKEERYARYCFKGPQITAKTCSIKGDEFLNP